MGKKELLQTLRKIKDLYDDARVSEAEQQFSALEEDEVENLAKTFNPEEAYEGLKLCADLSFDLDDYDRAINAYKMALNIDYEHRDFGACLKNLGIIYCERENYEDAIEDLTEALKHTTLNEDIVEIYRWMVISYKDSERYEDAIKVANKLIKHIKQRKDGAKAKLNEDVLCSTYSFLSVCYWRLSDERNSKLCFEKAISMNKSELETRALAYGTRAHQMYEVKNWQPALEFYEKAIDLTKDDEQQKKYGFYLETCRTKLKQL